MHFVRLKSFKSKSLEGVTDVVNFFLFNKKNNLLKKVYFKKIGGIMLSVSSSFPLQD